MENNLDLYMKIQAMVQNEARQIATEVYNDLGTKYSVAEVPTHLHNGVDSVQLNYKDIVQGNKYTTILVEDTTETTTIGGIQNPTRISFFGFVANNADGSPATKRAILNGEINFGTCFNISDPTPPIVVSTSGPGKPFIQSSNAMFIDTSALTKNHVFTNVQSFIYCEDDAATVIAQATVTSYNNQLGILTIDFILGANYKIQGAFTIM